MTRPSLRRRRGVVAVLAMLFLMLFSVLAVGFYAAVSTSVQVSHNEERATRALRAAESGVAFAQLQLAQLDIDADPDPTATLFNVHAELEAEMIGTGNAGVHPPTIDERSADDWVIHVPGLNLDGSANWMNVDGQGMQTRYIIEADGAQLTVKAIGRCSESEAALTAVRAIQLSFDPVQGLWTSPGAGVITRSRAEITNGAKILGGDVTSLTANAAHPSLTISGGAQLDGNFIYTDSGRAPSITNGAKITGDVLITAEPPSLPTVNVSPFEKYAPGPTSPVGAKVLDATSVIASNAVLTNIRIKANSNINFGNSVQLNGVIFVESPNQISFGGGVRVNGIVVTDNNASTPLSGNSIVVHNGCRIEGLQTLDPGAFPASDQIDDLIDMGGALIIAPNYKVELAGGSRTYDGTIVASEFDISNGYRGTIGGNLLCLADSAFRMVGGGQITFTAPQETITGLYAGTHYRLDPSSYREVDP